MAQYPVIVECDRKIRRKIRRRMRHYHLHWTGDKYVGNVSGWSYDALADFCREKHLKFYTDNEFGIRSNDYRYNFFKTNPPHMFGKYFCAYCGNLISKEKVTVDHLYPIGAVRGNIRLQKHLKRLGIKNINDVKNLVPACWACNSKKSKNMGLWIIKGRIGRYPFLWIIRHVLRTTLFVVAAYLFYKAGYYNKIVQFVRGFL